jgi:hypothetical protein
MVNFLLDVSAKVRCTHTTGRITADTNETPSSNDWSQNNNG